MLPWRQTTNDKQTKSENRASQQIDQGLLTFAITYTFQIEIPQKLMHNKLVCNEITGVYLQVLAGDDHPTPLMTLSPNHSPAKDKL